MWSDTQIKVKVPVGASNGKLTITVGEQKSNGVDFLVFPVIKGVIPANANVGNEITITGINFGVLANKSFVGFNSANASRYSLWNDTIIKVIVPKGAKSGKLSVTAADQRSNLLDIALTDLTPDEIQIGKQLWLTKNLDVDHYRNGDPIPQVTDSLQWLNLKTGAWCYYNNDSANGAIYGKLYNWYAVNDPRGLAPIGCHIPSFEEWFELRDSLGGDQLAGGKLKSTGTIEGGDGLWNSPNKNATNISGFSALPGSCRWKFGGVFAALGNVGKWWSSTEYQGSEEAGAWELDKDLGSFVPVFMPDMIYGFSVRCIKDK